MFCGFRLQCKSEIGSLFLSPFNSSVPASTTSMGARLGVSEAMLEAGVLLEPRTNAGGFFWHSQFERRETQRANSTRNKGVLCLTSTPQLLVWWAWTGASAAKEDDGRSRETTRAGSQAVLRPTKSATPAGLRPTPRFPWVYEISEPACITVLRGAREHNAEISRTRQQKTST